MDRSLINSLLLFVLGIASTAVATWYWTTRATRAKDTKDTLDRLVALEKQLALVGQTILPLSAAFQAVLIKTLTHFHTPEMDALLVKLGPPNELTTEDEARLAVLLEERERDMGDLIDDKERTAARILPGVMLLVKADMEMVHIAPQLQFVAIPIIPHERS